MRKVSFFKFVGVMMVGQFVSQMSAVPAYQKSYAFLPHNQLLSFNLPNRLGIFSGQIYDIQTSPTVFEIEPSDEPTEIDKADS
jgi:hypothetical protein